MERAAEMAKRALSGQGKVTPMAVFAYRGDPAHGEGGGVEEFKSVSLVWRTELQKETIRKRIKEKAAAERASAVVVLVRINVEGGRAKKPLPQEKGVLFFSAATANARASARVTYILEKEAKSVSSWEMHLSSEPGETFFLDGVFPVSKTRP